jgi:hypothetical protein
MIRRVVTNGSTTTIYDSSGRQAGSIKRCEAARPLPPSADIGPGEQSVGQAAQFCSGWF